MNEPDGQVFEIAAPGVRLVARVRGNDRPVLLLHGFPDTFDTWGAVASGGVAGLEDQFIAAGYRTIALAMRGYAPSGLPSDMDYSLPALAGDVIAALDHLDIERGWIVGHDWGASAAYMAAALYPERIDRMVTLAIPPFPVLPSGWRERIARPHNTTLAWGRASAWRLRRDNAAMVERLYRLWSPHWAVPAPHLDAVRTSLGIAERALAAVRYYSAPIMDADRDSMMRRIDVPTLAIFGEDEPITRRNAFAQALPWLGDGSRLEALPGVGHWPHAEAPEQVASLAASWFR